MRMRALVLAAAVGLLGIPGLATAAPAAPSPAQTGIAQTGIAPQPEFLLVRDGCGPGWYRASWQDRWGRWRQSCRQIEAWRERGPVNGGGWGRPQWRPGWGYYR
jgi:hypothetical protein